MKLVIRKPKSASPITSRRFEKLAYLTSKGIFKNNFQDNAKLLRVGMPFEKIANALCICVFLKMAWRLKRASSVKKRVFEKPPLKKLAPCPGFRFLIGGKRNPSGIAATSCDYLLARPFENRRIPSENRIVVHFTRCSDFLLQI